MACKGFSIAFLSLSYRFLLSLYYRFPIAFLSLSNRFPIAFLSLSYRFPIAFQSLSHRFPIALLSLSYRFPIAFQSLSYRFTIAFPSLSYRFPITLNTFPPRIALRPLRNHFPRQYLCNPFAIDLLIRGVFLPFSRPFSCNLLMDHLSPKFLYSLFVSSSVRASTR
jgi:hypothetical protein